MKKIVTLALPLLFASVCTDRAFSGCGDRGGPGYRNQAGKCVGWAALAQQCGNPPTTKCTAERPAEGAESAAVKGAEIRSLMDAVHNAKGR